MSDLLRSEFEEWASDNGRRPEAIKRNKAGYRLMQTHSDWTAWKACAAAIGVTWHRYPEKSPVVIGSYLVEKDSDDHREIEWAFFNSNGQWCASTGYFIDGEVTAYTRPPNLPQID